MQTLATCTSSSTYVLKSSGWLQARLALLEQRRYPRPQLQSV
jgi:hypothetical protein